VRATIRLVVILSMTAALVPSHAASPQAPQAPNPNVAPSEAGTGAISGVITDGTTNSPIAGAIVYLGPPMHGPPGAPVRQITDAKGRFLFRDLPAFGGYFIQVNRPGYVNGVFGRGSGGALGGRISLAEGQWFAEANVTMQRPGAVGGRVLDERGDPVIDAYVRVLVRVLVGGRPHVVAGPHATTDDRGAYRIAGLPPGRYLVQVPSVQSTMPVPAAPAVDPSQAAAMAGRPSNGERAATRIGDHLLMVNRFVPALPAIDGRPAAYPPTFHPNARDVQSATWIELGPAETRADIDFRLDPVATFRVSGRVDAPATAAAMLSLRLMPAGAEDLGSGSEAATALVSPDGSFTFLGVPAGAYTLVAHRVASQFETSLGTGQNRALPSAPAPPDAGRGWSRSAVLSGTQGVGYQTSTAAGEVWWGRMPINVPGRDVDEVALHVQRAATLHGRWVWEPGAEVSPGMPRMRLEPADGNPTLGLPQSPLQTAAGATDGEFVLHGLLPGLYVLSGLGPRVKSVSWNGRDHTHRPFDASNGQDITGVVVTLTNRTIVFSGVASDDRGRPSDAAVVIVFPAERDQWSNFGFSPARVKANATTTRGEYRFTSLPEGDYLVACVGIEHADDWKDPEFLARIAPLATRISLRWGENATQDLRLAAVR
jgi:hypothetical protein